MKRAQTRNLFYMVGTILLLILGGVMVWATITHVLNKGTSRTDIDRYAAVQAKCLKQYDIEHVRYIRYPCGTIDLLRMFKESYRYDSIRATYEV